MMERGGMASEEQAGKRCGSKGAFVGKEAWWWWWCVYESVMSMAGVG